MMSRNNHRTTLTTLGLALSLIACSDGGSGTGDTTSDAGSTATSTTGNTDASDDSTTASDETGLDDTTGTTGTTGTDNDDPSHCGGELVGGGTAGGFNTLILNIGDVEYKVQTNPWGGAEQTITAGSGNIFRVDSITHPQGGQPWDVASFPSVYRGMPYSGEGTTDSEMPARIGDISSVETGLKTNAQPATYQGNATYDVYFTNSENYTGGPPDVYLMVWFDAKGLNPINSPGEGWDCTGQAPTFIDACSGAGSTSIGGKTFHRFFGPNGSSNVITYVADQRMNEWEFDLNLFIQDAVGQGILNNDMYLQGVQAGFELADAGAGLAISEFCVDVD